MATAATVACVHTRHMRLCVCGFYVQPSTFTLIDIHLDRYFKQFTAF